jgi:ABC-type glycerol-3-phosphate transport system substrate-binding protein
MTAMTSGWTRRAAAWLLVLGLAACDQPALQLTATAPPPPATATTPAVQPVATPLPSATFMRPGDPVTLTVWTTEEFAPTAETAAGARLTLQLGAYEESHAGARVEVVLKKPYGPGGLLDFLRHAAPVAPALLPDLMVLDAAELPAAARAGLLTPLEGRVGADVVDDLYPFARTLGSVDELLFGVAFAADVQHLAYNRAFLNEPPLSWGDVLSGTTRLGFAAANRDAMDATLADYLAAGGTLADAGGRPHLDSEPLTRVLRYYEAAQANDRFVDGIAQVETPAEAWELYRSGRSAQTLINAGLFLADRETLRTTEIAVPPGPARPAPGVARAWIWILPARQDPVRQQLAVELLSWLVSPANLAEWSLAANRLPTRRDALARWPSDDAYIGFLGTYLEVAVPQPSAEVSAKIMPALYRAVQAVLVNRVPPEVAAAAATAEVGP